ncbi:SusC/RagA family TonB-linked outer membrane protein [Thermophagus sp. OGC60D27]|uniref:SusC/RagA family TonB-linked outer membrane protein n=1 Tax=Thermophagus sp. OGC60D27 TaxID=3458415 RepID=UPI0040377DAA
MKRKKECYSIGQRSYVVIRSLKIVKISLLLLVAGSVHIFADNYPDRNLPDGNGEGSVRGATETNFIFQQNEKTVTGIVTDENGDPIPGATIQVKGSTFGTITDMDGNYSIEVSSDEVVLVYSFVGMKTLEVVVGTQILLDVSLEPDVVGLDEVVVIGYGTQRKGDVTSAVASVKSEDFIQGKIQDAAELVKGKIAGLTISKGTGDPNAQSTIRLRGVISLEGSSNPLILIDGVEGGLGTVPPENIASIDVLKDASAAAIYGTRGANGVILITTKSGKRDTGTRSGYSGYMSVSQFGKTLDFMGTNEIRQGLTDFTDKGYDTDWLEAISQNAFTHNHDFFISGGTEKTTYSGNFNYRKEEGVIIDTYNEEMKMSFDISHWMLNDMLKVNLNLVKGIHENSATNAGDNGASNIYRQAIIHNPTEPIWNEDGTYYENFQVNYYYNPVGMIKERQGTYESEWTRVTGNITFKPIDDWETNLMLATRRSNSHDKGYYTSNYYSQKMDNHTGYAYHSQSDSKTDNLELTSKYNKTINNHRLNALIGYSYQYEINQGFNANNYDFQTDFFLYNNLSVGGALKEGKAGMGSYKNDNKLIGFFGRISYGYANKYNALLSIRREGSSKFGENHKWGDFPSASLGWTISNENFMSNISWLENLKLRAGYGVTGVIPNSSYLSLTRYSLGSSYYYEDGEWKPGLEVSSNPNPDLKWEKSKEINIGLDFSVLDDRLGGAIDVYNKETSDMLWWFDVPTPPNLYSQTLANVGEMRNRGIEIAINAVPVKSANFEWNTTLTASHNANKLLSLSNDLYETANEQDDAWLGEPISIPTQRLEVGEELGNFFGLKSVGVSENGLWLIENPATGEAEEFTDNMLNNDDYRQYLGNGIPDINLGWSNSFRYKNFDLSFQMTSQLGFKILNEPRAFYENNSIAYNRLSSVQNPPYGGEYTLSSSQKQTIVSYYLEDGDFVKLTNLTLGYTVPLQQNSMVKKIRAYVSGDNLICITGYDGLDPELSNNNVRSMGIDWRDKYPVIRSFTFGVNITF